MRPATGWIPNRTRTPRLVRSAQISATELWALATARPYPGTIITCLACASNPAAASAQISVCGACSRLSSPASAEALTVAPPNMTEPTSRFIASHMMSVNIAPDTPMSAPTEARRGDARRKPSAVSAQPEYEFSTVITTGMSAPPTEAVRRAPRRPESAAIPVRTPAPAPGTWSTNAAATSSPPAAETRRAPPPTQSNARAPFKRSRFGGWKGFEETSSASLANATRDPVVVTPPMTTAAPSAASAPESSRPSDARYSPTAAATAATPTSEWKAATVWGSSVGPTLLATAYPAAPPPPMSPATCTAVEASICIEPSTEDTPSATPDMPMTLPIRAVC
mmetsp:Transcript_15978/g.37071  ORF Transcript_15978/g.37071 Transcript_15978/m.37071 type:complete len:337 (-) Transcript_15978:2035-3045(-)